MIENFEELYGVNRKGTGSYKWDGMKQKFGDEDLIPLWVADMDFKAPEKVIEALRDYVDKGVFGYAIPPESYFESIIAWEKNRHNFEIKKEWLRYTPGVVPGLFWAVNTFTQPEDACLVQTPCYYPFLDAVTINQRTLICCDLEPDANGHYTVNFQKFEQTIIDYRIKMFLLCSPHNPVGRVWTRAELETMMELCKKHKVYVVSDEIHQDLIMPGFKHIPTATVGNYDDFLITVTAPSKTFNLAGMQNAFAIIPNPDLKQKYESFIKTLRINKGSSLGYVAAEAAYRYGEDWLNQIIEVIYNNYQYLRDTLKDVFPDLGITPLEGTYLMWIDLKPYVKPEQLVEIVQTEARMAVDFGRWFWPSNETDCHIRVNLATPSKNIKRAAELLIKSIKSHT